MSEAEPQIMERTFCPALIGCISECGGTGVQEVSFDSEPDIVFKLLDEVRPKLERRVKQAYPLRLVISLLQQHVSELVDAGSLADPLMLRVITDRRLLSAIGRRNPQEADVAARFFASYILLRRILFLRLFGSAQPDKLSAGLLPVAHYSLRAAFGRVLETDYRPIQEVNVQV